MRRGHAIRWVAVAIVALLGAGSLVAWLTGDGGMTQTSAGIGAAGSPSSDVMEGFEPDAESEALAAAKASGAAAGSGATGSSGAVDIPGARVVRTATLTVEVGGDKFSAAFDRLLALAAANGGFVSSSSTAATGSEVDEGQLPASGTAVLRVPAERFDAVRAAAGDLGKVIGEEVKGEDVGGQLVDLGARLANLRAQEEATRSLMEKTKTVGETVQVQQQLFAVREQIEQLTAQQARLTDAANLSTITATMREPGAFAREPAKSSPLATAFSRAVHGAELVLAGTIVVTGYLLPLSLLAGGAWLLVRLALRRSVGVATESD